MEVTIIQGEIKYLADCLEALMHSELARTYLPDEAVAKKHLTEAFARNEMHLALNNAGKCVGFITFALSGTFYEFPYVCNISVNAAYRGQGIGTRLLKHFEEAGFKHANKVFLLVSDFNVRAKKLYEALGYKQVGIISDLYKAGIAEYLMMKVKPANHRII